MLLPTFTLFVFIAFNTSIVCRTTLGRCEITFNAGRGELCRRGGWTLLLTSPTTCVSVPVWAGRLSGCLWRKISHAEVFNSEFPIILLCTHDGNNTTWKYHFITKQENWDAWDVWHRLVYLSICIPPVTNLGVSMLPSSLILWSSSSKISSSDWLMYLVRGGWGNRLCWREKSHVKREDWNGQKTKTNV